MHRQTEPDNRCVVMRQEQQDAADAAHSDTPARTSPTRTPRVAMEVRKAQHPRSLAQGEGDRCGRSERRVTRQPVGSLERSGSAEQPVSLNSVMRHCFSGTHLVICDKVVCAHALDLRRAEHPAHVVDDLDVCRRRLRKL